MANGPSIKVAADISGFRREMESLDRSMKKVIDRLDSGEVGIDTDDALRHLSDLEKKVTRLRDVVSRTAAEGDLSDLGAKEAAEAMEKAASVAKVLEAAVKKTGGPSSGMAEMAKQARQTEENLKRATRAQEVLAREGIQLTQRQSREAQRAFDQLRKSGARGTTKLRGVEFADWLGGGWRDYSLNEKEAQRHRADVLRRLGVEIPGGAPGGKPGSKPGAGRAALLARAGRAALGGAGGAAGGMLGGGDGGLWGAAGGMGGAAIGAGAGLMFGGPVGAVVGMFAGQLLGSLGSSMDRMIGQAGEEGATYTDLRQALGATTTDFEMLRGSVRHFTEGLGVAYNESARLAAEFARTAALQSSAGLGAEVGTSIAFGRGYGLSPADAVRFMAQMRHVGASANDRDNRRLALMIGESVNSGGTQARMGEVLTAIQSYATSQARASLSAPDVGAFASFLSSMTGQGMYGLKGDPSAAAAAMTAADAAMRQGGAYGEASKNFSLGLWQRMMPGFNAFDLDYVNEQGAFGSVAKAFGRDSAAYQFAAERGDKGKMAAYDRMVAQGGGRTVMSAQMEALEQFYGGDTDEFRKAIQSHFGVGASQATALYRAYKSDRGLGGLEESLRGAGVDIDKMNAKQVASLADLAGTDKAGLQAQARKLLDLGGGKTLSKEEREQLESAKGSEEELRRVVLRLTAMHDTSTDQGDQMRRLQTDMNNALQKLATELIPLTMWIKEGVLELVKYLPGETEFERKHAEEQRALAAERAEAGRLDSEIDGLRKRIDGFKEDSPDERKGKIDALVSLQGQRAAAAARGDQKAVEGYDHNIRLMQGAIRAGSADGKADLIAEHDRMVSARNRIDSQPAARAPYGADAAPGPADGGAPADQGSPVDGVKLSGDKAEFLAKTRGAAEAAAERINRETGSNVTPEMIQAQWALETGWGKRMLPGTNNLGNIKAGRGWHGKTKDVTVPEHYGGRDVMSRESFRAYGSLEEAGADYGALLARRYMNGKPASSNEEFAARMREGGYATDPAYERKLLQVMNSIPQQDGQLPAGASAASAPQTVDVRVRVDGAIPVVDANGAPTGQELPVTGHVSQPRAYGG